MDENGTESGGVDAQIPVTASVDASGYENVSRLDPHSFWAVFSGCGSGRLLVAVALVLDLVAFGVCVRRLWFGFLSVGSKGLATETQTEQGGWHQGRNASKSVGARSRTFIEMGLPFHVKL